MNVFRDGLGTVPARFCEIASVNRHNGARKSEHGAVKRQRSVVPPLALGALMCAVLAASATSALAATADTAYNAFGVDSPDSQAGEIFSQRIEDADLGDGVRDVFASSYLSNFSSHASNVTAAGQVTLFNGRDRSIRYELRSPEPQDNAQFGFYMQDLGDVNGNGKDDLAVGAPGQNVNAAGNACTVGTAGCNANQGKVFVFEGATGQLLYGINSPAPQSHPSTSPRGFGSRIGSAGDVNGDGIGDIIVGASAYDAPAGCSTVSPLPPTCHKGEGEAYVLSGKDGSLIRKLNLPPGDEPAASCSDPSTGVSCGGFGSTVQSPGDVNGDGVPDQFVSAPTLKPTADHHGRVYLFSGKDGTLLTRIDAPETGARQFFGLQDAARNTPGDVNGDGVADIYVNAFLQNGSFGPSQGKAWVFDGKASAAAGHGVLLYEVKDPSPGAGKSFGFVASRTDYNKDGVPDLLVGGIGGVDHEVYITNGKDGSPLKTLAMPASEVQPNVTGNSGSSLGTGSRALDDINGDGEPDYVAGAAYQDVGGNQDQGRVFFFLSNVPTTPPGGGASSSGSGLSSSGSTVAPPACTISPLLGSQGPILTSAVNNSARQVSRSRSANLLKHNGFSLSVNTVRPGTAFVSLKGPKRVTMAFVKRTYSKANRVTIKVKLTRKGRKLLDQLRRGHRRTVKVTLTVKFATDCRYAPSRSKSVHIKR